MQWLNRRQYRDKTRCECEACVLCVQALISVGQLNPGLACSPLSECRTPTLLSPASGCGLAAGALAQAIRYGVHHTDSPMSQSTAWTMDGAMK